jgi:hypothetical protein
LQEGRNMTDRIAAIARGVLLVATLAVGLALALSASGPIPVAPGVWLTGGADKLSATASTGNVHSTTIRLFPLATPFLVLAALSTATLLLPAIVRHRKSRQTPVH